MTESPPESYPILLFGRRLADLVVRPSDAKLEKVSHASSDSVIDQPTKHPEVDDSENGNVVLLAPHADARQSKRRQVKREAAIRDDVVDCDESLDERANLENAAIARIYGFSVEGTYCQLDRPTLFLVHGAGEPAAGILDGPAAAHAPTVIGLAEAEFELADPLKVWSYDGSDHTVRMEVQTGILEHVLVDPFLADSQSFSDASVAGAKPGGAKSNGAEIGGANIRGVKISGGKVTGAKLR